MTYAHYYIYDCFCSFISTCTCKKAYKKKTSPSKTDFDLDEKLLAILKTIANEEEMKGEMPKEYIFNRAVTRNAKEGTGVAGAVFSSGKFYLSLRKISQVSILFGSYVPGYVFYHVCCCIALVASEKLIMNDQSSSTTEPIDAVSIANNIGYYADGLDVYQGFTWRWEDGKGDLIERVYSAAETEDQLMVEAKEGDSMERSEPYSPLRKVSINLMRFLFSSFWLDHFIVSHSPLQHLSHIILILACLLPYLRVFLVGYRSNFPSLLWRMRMNHCRSLD